MSTNISALISVVMKNWKYENKEKFLRQKKK